MSTFFPPINLDPRATPWGKKMQSTLLSLEAALNRNLGDQRKAASAASSTLATLSGQVQDLEAVTSDLSTTTSNLTSTTNKLTTTTNSLTDVTNLLTAMGGVQYAEWSASGGLTGFTGFTANTTASKSVTINSPSGRLEVGFGGSLNGGDGYIVYSIANGSTTVVNRTTVFGNYAQRVALTGGASFIGSGFNSLVVTVPANVNLTVKVELYAAQTSTTFFGSKIFARVAP